MDFYFFLVITHLIGAVLGVGGATFIEINLIKALRDGLMEPLEASYLKSAVRVTRIGTIISIISGLGFFYITTRYVHNPVFWAKMTILGIVLLNAYLLDKHKMPLWLGSPLSFVSWYFLLILGEMLRGTGGAMGFWEAMLYYGAALLIGGVILDAIRKKLTVVIPAKPIQEERRKN